MFLTLLSKPFTTPLAGSAESYPRLSFRAILLHAPEPCRATLISLPYFYSESDSESLEYAALSECSSSSESGPRKTLTQRPSSGSIQGCLNIIPS